MHRSILFAVCLLCVSLSPARSASPPIQAIPLVNPGFEDGTLGQPAPGWSAPQAILDAGYSIRTAEEEPESGKKCLQIARAGAKKNPQAFGASAQTIDAAPYRGKRLRFTAAVRVEGGSHDTAQLWMRVDRPGGAIGFFDNMGDRPVASATWQKVRITGPVSADAQSIRVGFLLPEEGRAWFDSATLEVLGDAAAGNEPARPLTDRGRENLAAFAQLYGTARWFHPSDQAAAADWGSFAIAGVQRVEKAASAAELARILEELFHPLAPTVRVFPTGHQPPLPDTLRHPAAGRILFWRHLGVALGADPKNSVYRSVRVDDGPEHQAPAKPDEPFVADLGGGVSALVPLALWADAAGTLPHVDAGVRPPQPDKPEGFAPSGDDRATRLADVIQAWNVFEHFYPYFDVAALEGAEDWPAVLRASLRDAAVDPDAAAFTGTLSRLVVALHDGHGHVSAGGMPVLFLPAVAWSWIENNLVVTWADPEKGGGLRPGDLIRSIDGKPARQVLEAAEAGILGATPQWRRTRALAELAGGPKDSEVKLEVQPLEGPVKTVTVPRTAPPYGPGNLNEARQKALPEKIAEVRPGIFYVDLSRITDDDFTAAVDRLAAAKGVVFDLRGYPRNVSPDFLQHLSDQVLHSAQWNIPVTTRPHRQGVTWVQSNWTLEPLKPRFQGKIAFLTGGGAISYAESCMGIVEAYHLGAIVGSPTAGTNGNVNPFTLPGGYTISWTGMKVLKQDGSRHHGVGIQPTVPAAPTRQGVAAGKDEVLEKGVEVVGR
jgi:C-terminal processing protease CtpA/Prc